MVNQKKVNTVIDLIRKNITTQEDLQEIIHFVNRFAKSQDSQDIMLFNIGDKVVFIGKLGAVLHGKVTKINRTSVSVKVSTVGPGVKTLFNIPQNWRVSPSLLRKDE